MKDERERKIDQFVSAIGFEDPVVRHRAVPHSERDRDAGAGGSKLLLGKQNTAYYVKTI